MPKTSKNRTRTMSIRKLSFAPNRVLLKQLRSEVDLKQAEIEEILGWARGKLTQYESGPLDIPIDHLEELAAFYKRHPADLIDKAGLEDVVGILTRAAQIIHGEFIYKASQTEVG